jgi:hypothetical protein
MFRERVSADSFDESVPSAPAPPAVLAKKRLSFHRGTTYFCQKGEHG